MNKICGKVIGELRRSKRVDITGLDRAAHAYLLSSLHRAGQRSILIISPTISEVARLVEDLGYFLGDTRKIFPLPSYETLPFEEESPDVEIAARRMAALSTMAEGREGIFICSSHILTQRLMPPGVLREAGIPVSPDQTLDIQKLAGRLERMGYARVNLVENPGEYGIRGSIMDIFSPGWENPVRLDLIGDSVEEMKWFDPVDQRSLSRADGAYVIPAQEIIGEETVGTFLERSRVFWPRCGRDSSILTRLGTELGTFGVQPWHTVLLPLFYEDPATIFDYCLPHTLVVLLDHGGTLLQARGSLENIKKRGEEEGYPGTFMKRFLKEVSKALVMVENKTIDCPPMLGISSLGSEGGQYAFHLPAWPVSLNLAGRYLNRSTGRWHAIEQIEQWLKTYRIIFVCRTSGSARRLTEILSEYGLGSRMVENTPFDPSWTDWRDRSLMVHVGELKSGFRMEEDEVVFITEEDLFGPKHHVQERRSARTTLFDLDFSSLKPGDHLVHEEYGIGIFAGLERIRVDSHKEDMLALHYADGGRLYVPMDRLYLVQRYVYSKGHKPIVDRLGGRAWPQAKRKVRRAVRKLVKELLRLQAQRQTKSGMTFQTDGPWQKEFEAGFEYEETEDQWRSIEEVKRDMESPRPMDRLVCGDVGYGKTEVAMRAAFKAVSDGRQVAVLAPTTVLCQQHCLTFRRRFDPFPMRVEMLSRFASPGAQKDIINSLAEGTVDVVIGTHKLLQKDIRFRDLGLLVIDEEQRFGVKDKERIKNIKETVDVLSLSATPIPRTFYMAMSGMRDLSVIETPPLNRLGVKTKVLPFSEKVIREAIMREMAREGQVFFLHNRVKSIRRMAEYLATIVPEARIAVAHGQMSEKVLKQVMDNFISGDIDVLVSTSIIESGMDIPNANTMIINRADRFGLADLYQLRGRIGRSAHQAYAYLMVPDGRLTDTAQHRLGAIETFSELGSGVKIAALDLEIRGAGNLLGYEQSGRMAEVGLEMYTRILEETVHEIKGESLTAAATRPPEIVSPFSSYIPDNYMPDVSQRLTTYKKLTLVGTEADLADFAEELTDIFGQPPGELRTLLDICGLRLAAMKSGVEKIVLSPGFAEVLFNQTTPVEPQRIIDFIRTSRGSMRLKGPDCFIISLPSSDPTRAIQELKNRLLEIYGYDTVPPTVERSRKERNKGKPIGTATKTE